MIPQRPTSNEEKVKKAMSRRAASAYATSVTSKYFQDKDGNIYRETLHQDDDGTIRTSLTKMGYPNWAHTYRVTIETKTNSIKIIMGRLIKAILRDEPQKEIERLVLQLDYPQTQIEALFKKSKDNQNGVEYIELLIADELSKAGADLDKVIEAISNTEHAQTNPYLLNAIEKLTQPEIEVEAER